MPISYEPIAEQHHFKDRFSLACPPTPRLVRPGEQGLFIRRPRGDRQGSLNAARFEAAMGRWGLIPLFAPSPEVADTHEAHGETAANERNFYQPWKRGHRCVVLADAILRQGDKEGEVVRVTRADGEPLTLAGLWNGWRSPLGECIESFALFTLPAQDHPDQRRVVFLRDAWVDDWLHCPVEETSAYLRPYAIDKLVRERVVGGDGAPLPAISPSS